MTSAETLERPSTEGTDSDDEVTHIVCCDDVFCICGIPIDHNNWGDTGYYCVICYYMACPECGSTEGVL